MYEPETPDPKFLTFKELQTVGTLVDLVRSDWTRRSLIIQCFLDATSRRIVASDDTLGGQARLEGTRLSLAFIRDLLESVGAKDVLRDYPQLIEADLRHFICKTQKV